MLKCRECDGEELSWQSWDLPAQGTFRQSGRTVFFLGCDGCSATMIHSVSAEDVAEALNAYGWRPGNAD